MDSRKYYVKEYDEALSRLEAAERTPGPFIPRPLGPTPYYKTPENWNRIMRETRHGVLPKYTITQRFRCSWDEKMAKGDHDMIYYKFKLDPNFAFCNGARKSLAIRRIAATPIAKIKSFIGKPIRFNIRKENFEIYIQDQTVEGLEDCYHKMVGSTKHLAISENKAYDPDLPDDPINNNRVTVGTSQVENEQGDLGVKILRLNWEDNNDINLSNMCTMIQVWLQYHFFGDNKLHKFADTYTNNKGEVIDLPEATVKCSDYFDVEVTCEDRNIHIRFRIKPGKCVKINGGFYLFPETEGINWFFGINSRTHAYANRSKKVMKYKPIHDHLETLKEDIPPELKEDEDEEAEQ